ncbi:hypothetical protein Tcan_11342 [Toxocara canis]|uniref:Uncharacterized protein n=1 Tax=Toxocara canis TaxID=6265 RepID=A0A0B2VSA7_TOXCA|nr:hypothetical protein Tcan_11342 [Toxocara canis]
MKVRRTSVSKFTTTSDSPETVRNPRVSRPSLSLSPSFFNEAWPHQRFIAKQECSDNRNASYAAKARILRRVIETRSVLRNEAFSNIRGDSHENNGRFRLNEQPLNPEPTGPQRQKSQDGV